MASLFTTIWEAFFGKPAARGGPGTPPVAAPSRPATPRGSHRLEIQETDADGNVTFEYGGQYFVEGRKSLNGRFLVGARGAGSENGRARSGAVVLVDLAEGRELFRATVKRPQNPQVSDAGLVTAEDWKDSGGPLAGAFMAFDVTGKKVWSHTYKANIYGSGMAGDGETVFVSTCNSDHERHSGKTWLLNARTGETVWVRDGFGEVRFVGSVLSIGLEGDRTKGNRFFPLNPDGSAPNAYLNARHEHEMKQNRGKPWWVLPQVADALADPTTDMRPFAEMLGEVERGGHSLTDMDRARIERFHGEIAERGGDLAEALRRWERALQLDAKVGIKRRYDALRKRQAG